MLATWARDVYRSDERAALRRAIDTIASPNTGDGFASNGVYTFFDPDAKETLYIGLARDLSDRFAQHNGLIRMPENGCKVAQVRDWFQNHDRLGYAALLQSPFSQAGVARQRGKPTQEFFDEESNVFWSYDPEGLSHIADVEGQLIAAYVERFGKLPPWNKIHGFRDVHNAPTPNTVGLLDLAAGASDSLLLSRASIRELADDPEMLHFEETLHMGRFGAIELTGGRGIDSPAIIESLQQQANMPEHLETGLVRAWNRMCELDYFFRPAPPPARSDVPGRMRRRST